MTITLKDGSKVECGRTLMFTGTNAVILGPDKTWTRIPTSEIANITESK